MIIFENLKYKKIDYNIETETKSEKNNIHSYIPSSTKLNIDEKKKLKINY